MLGETIKRIRKEAGLNQVAFAEAIGCSQSFMSRMEREHHMPSHALALRLVRFAKARKIKVRLEELFSE